MKLKHNHHSEDTMQVLIIDDEPGIRDACERILKRMNFTVFKAGRGDEGLEILKREKISIVLLDLKMPGMDGLEVLGHIRHMDISVQVIIITGFATIETAIEAMKQGAYDFIPKPFEPDHLRLIVDRARENLRLSRETEKLELERYKTLLDLRTEKSRIRTIIESLPSGLIVTNTRSRVMLMNPAFFHLFGLDYCQLPGDPIETYVENEGFCQMVRDISAGKYTETDEPPTYELALPNRMYLMARGKPVTGEDGECLGAVINLTNITTMKVVDQLKTEFVAKVSHELRSPLSTIHEQLALVLGDMVPDSDRDQYILTRAKEKTKGLLTLIGDLLDLTRIESGAVTREQIPVHIDSLLGSIAEFIRPQAQAKSQTLVVEVPETPLPVIIADPLAIESIFGNLITNAVKYTPDGGKIRVRLSLESGRKIRVDVEDNGFGIAEKYQAQIFERFFRVKDEHTRFIVGSGLGLPIVKGLVDAFKGTISLKSEPGKGSAFTVLIPIDRREDDECMESAGAAS